MKYEKWQKDKKYRKMEWRRELNIVENDKNEWKKEKMFEQLWIRKKENKWKWNTK